MNIIFMGTPDFAVASLDALIQSGCTIVGVVTAADKPAGRGQKLGESAVKKYAIQKGLKVLQPNKLKDPNFLAELKKYGLVQLGSGAWISKMKEDDIIEKGNIILIHGNGNEERRALEVLYEFIDNTNLQFLKLENEIKNS